MRKISNLLLVLAPIAIAGDLIGLPPIALFFLSALAVVPLAKLIGEATEELSTACGPALSGLLNASFGNATELIIGVLAIHRGLVEVVKASLTGSIIGNLLFVLGMAVMAGGSRYKTQAFNRSAAQASASTLLLAVIAMTIPAIFLHTSPSIRDGITTEELSVVVAILMVATYFASLLFALHTHADFYRNETEQRAPAWSMRQAVCILTMATAAVTWVSDILVRSIQPVADILGWTQLFIGVVVVAVVGNAAEHTSAIVAALKNQMDLTLQISIGSATQIAMFVAPVLVLGSTFFPTPMNLVFNDFELVAIILSVLIVNQVVSDGESNWLEGLQLIVAYSIIAAAFFLHP
jgi:Ca2+:H+ antiporter